ncbi:hypothetical protein IE81DRAFT_350580 [Ceraceosorus guamensis]|uniref:R3H-associated N-terminal domain-containing protein n=1 Tax=Ceraceosorus guamensis TaxID=1522189 RepID=A0A316VN40_9BASI|nr:hypothetical protein IE81DRAFT_350580 [Ceraceosorus guamensis]PWN38992.1 hypothetical protein IE81DRAFT_350580 [Ceraceosorus guamensis]
MSVLGKDEEAWMEDVLMKMKQEASKGAASTSTSTSTSTGQSVHGTAATTTSDHLDSSTSTSSSRDGPVAMSMPALLINPRLRNLNLSASGAGLTSSSRSTGGAGASMGAAQGKRSVGKRKTRRAENARLGGNPHIAAPRPSDYNLPHPNPVRPSHHPLPSSLNPHTSKTSKSATAASSSSSSSRRRPDGPPDLGPDSRQISQALEDAKAGQYTLSIREAKYFLREKLGLGARMTLVESDNRRDDERRQQQQQQQQQQMVPTEDSSRNVGPTQAFDTVASDSSRDVGPAQAFALVASEHLQEWLHQDVHICRKDAAPASARTLIGAAEQSTAVRREQSGQKSDSPSPAPAPALLLEKSRAPHALVWICPDPFLRLVLHCLARVHGCPSFSKEEWSSSSSSSSPSAFMPRRETWILHPRPAARPRRQSRFGNAPALRGLAAGSGRAAAAAAGLDTPPTTDMGTDMDSATEAETESLAESEVDEMEEGEEKMVERQQQHVGAEQGTRDADETLIPLQEEEEGDEEWAADLDEGEEEEEGEEGNHSLSGSVASLGIVE